MTTVAAGRANATRSGTFSISLFTVDGLPWVAASTTLPSFTATLDGSAVGVTVGARSASGSAFIVTYQKSVAAEYALVVTQTYNGVATVVDTPATIAVRTRSTLLDPY